MTERNQEFANAIDKTIEDFMRLGVSREYAAALLEMKARALTSAE